jgi:hypothetical protein
LIQGKRSNTRCNKRSNNHASHYHTWCHPALHGAPTDCKVHLSASMAA